MSEGVNQDELTLSSTTEILADPSMKKTVTVPGLRTAYVVSL